jgi:3-oxoacyl-[acyl-carrier-protein] synthase-3
MIKAPTKYGIADIQVAAASTKLHPERFGFDLSEDYYQNVSGARTVFAAGAEEDAFALCSQAAAKMLAKHPGLAAELDALFVVTLPTEPTVAPVSSRLQGALGAKPNTFCLDLTLSCVGFLQAASLVLDLMPARGWKRVLVFNVETLTKIIRPDDHALRLIMSDGACATLFTDEAPLTFERFEFFADGKLADILGAREGRMHMDGPRVYETVLRRIPSSLRASLESAGVGKQDVDLFLFHQASKKILDKLSELLELDEAKVPRAIETGNMGSCSLPQLLAGVLEERRERCLSATAFGAGFQWAHALMRQKG